MRARWTVEELARGQWRIAVTELPFGVSTRVVLEDIERATNPKPKEGKKSLSQEQLNLKSLMLSALDTVRDESDKSVAGAHRARAEIEPAGSAGVHEPAARQHASGSEPADQSRDAGPRRTAAFEDLKQIIEEWIGVPLRNGARAARGIGWAQVDRRIHILEGRQLALLSIDKVIRIIRKADDPKADLIAEFGLTEIQADDILEIRLRQLARLEGIKIEDELKALKSERKELEADPGRAESAFEPRRVGDRGGCQAVR